MICSSEKRFFTSNLLRLGDWTPNRGATQKRGDVGANEVKLGVRDQWHLEDHQTFFDRKTIVLPDIVARDGLASELALKPLFDLLWQAAGFTSSQNYDSAGQRLID